MQFTHIQIFTFAIVCFKSLSECQNDPGQQELTEPLHCQRHGLRLWVGSLSVSQAIIMAVDNLRICFCCVFCILFRAFILNVFLHSLIKEGYMNWLPCFASSAEANRTPCRQLRPRCRCTSSEESHEGFRYATPNAEAPIYNISSTRCVLQMLLFNIHRNRWRRNHRHCSTEEQCSEARDNSDLQIPAGKGRATIY